jgi:hypothetical protein
MVSKPIPFFRLPSFRKPSSRHRCVVPSTYSQLSADMPHERQNLVRSPDPWPHAARLPNLKLSSSSVQHSNPRRTTGTTSSAQPRHDRHQAIPAHQHPAPTRGGQEHHARPSASSQPPPSKSHLLLHWPRHPAGPATAAIAAGPPTSAAAAASTDPAAPPRRDCPRCTP